MTIQKLFNLAKVASTTTGTGDVTLGSAKTGFLSFADAGVSDGDVVSYGIRDGEGFEIGRGTYSSTGPKLARTTVLKSSNSNAALDLSGSDVEVFISPLAEDFDVTGNLAGGFWTSTDVAAAATCDIGAATTPLVKIAGTATITSFGTKPNRVRRVHFNGALTIARDDTWLILPGSGNITTEAGEDAEFVSDGSGHWRCTEYPPRWVAVSYEDLTDLPTLPSGDIVGTSDTQILTNKTIDAASNKIAGLPYKTVATVEAESIAGGIEAIRTSGYSAPGDLGGACYVKVSSEPSHSGKIQSADGAWWEIAEARLLPQMLGAKADGTTDDTTAVQNTLDVGKPVFLVGTYLVSDKLTSSGPTKVQGHGKNFSKLLWDSASSDAGIYVTPTAFSDLIEIQNIALWTSASEVGNAIHIDWSALGTTGITFFETKSIVENNDIRSVVQTTQGFLNGIVLEYPFSIRVSGNVIQGKYSASFLESDDFISQVGISVPDQSQRTLANLRVDNNEILGFMYGMDIQNVEGCWVHDNDIQVCYVGMRFINTISRVNQYRIYGNHIGVSADHIVINTCAYAIISNNEISYRNGRTTSIATLISITDLTGGQIIGNTLRGNQAGTGTITLVGINLSGTVSSNTNSITIDGNLFKQLDDAIIQRVTAQSILIGPANNYDTIYTTIFTNDNSAGGHVPARMGSGSYDLPSGLLPALYLSNNSSAPLSLNRESTTGAIASFHSSAGGAAGVISLASASSVTYGTSSDYRKKLDIEDLTDSGAFIDALRPRKFVMDGIRQAGFIAHEFSEVSPISVTGEKDAVDDEGRPVYQTMQASSSEVMAHLICELQSLRKRLAKLEE